jgi:hypothetical protein
MKILQMGASPDKQMSWAGLVAVACERIFLVHRRRTPVALLVVLAG